jgi:hypothetical protein
VIQKLPVKKMNDLTDMSIQHEASNDGIQVGFFLHGCQNIVPAMVPAIAAAIAELQKLRNHAEK